MKITNNQMIGNIRSILRDVVMPEMQSELARARLRSVLATLRDVDWDDAPFALMRENEALQALVDGWSRDAAPRALAPPSMSAALERNDALRARIAEHFASAAGEGWGPQHQQAAQVLGACARDRGRPPAKTE
jgi:hypothetical protein